MFDLVVIIPCMKLHTQSAFWVNFQGSPQPVAEVSAQKTIEQVKHVFVTCRIICTASLNITADSEGDVFHPPPERAARCADLCSGCGVTALMSRLAFASLSLDEL